MKVVFTAKDLISKSQSAKESTEKLIQSIIAIYGMGIATTDMQNGEPVMIVDAIEFLKVMTK